MEIYYSYLKFSLTYLFVPLQMLVWLMRLRNFYRESDCVIYIYVSTNIWKKNCFINVLHSQKKNLNI